MEPKVHHRVHNSPLLVSILIQMHPVHKFPLYFRKRLLWTRQWTFHFH